MADQSHVREWRDADGKITSIRSREYASRIAEYKKNIPIYVEHDEAMAGAYKIALNYLEQLSISKSSKEDAEIEAKFRSMFKNVTWVENPDNELTGSAGTIKEIETMVRNIKRHNIPTRVVAHNSYGLIDYDPENGDLYDKMMEEEET
jgi:hypothetical protein